MDEHEEYDMKGVKVSTFSITQVTILGAYDT